MPAEDAERSIDAAEVFDFLDEFARDTERGRAKRLAEYLARYPGHEEAIAREFLRLQSAAQRRETTADSAASHDAASSLDSASPSDGRRIGPYRLVRELGVGGQGAVWLSEDTRIAREVALKFMPSSFALLSADRRRRMQREAEVVSRLQHPSICPVYEAQIDHDPPYIAMRYVDGETLASAISRARSGDRNGPLPLPPRTGVELRRVLSFVERAARALHAAHEAGVIHRDIKPGNVMVTPAGEPVLLDFGQARDERAELDQRTLSGEVFGTPMYMSPEQVAGSSSGIDRRTDVWSLGASLFEALTLARPFLGDSVPAVLLAIQRDPLPPVRRMNAALEEDVAVVLETALEKDLSRRYSTALEFAEDLRRVREYEPIHARTAGPMLRVKRWAQRQPALAASIALIIGSLSTGLVWSLHLLERESQAKGEAIGALEARKEMLDHALARQIAGRSLELLDDDPALALALGLFADEITPGLYQTRAALLPALDACKLARQIDGGRSARLVLDMDLFADSTRLVAGLDDCSVQVWDLRSGVEIAFVEHPDWAIGAVCAHPSGAWFATAGEDGRVRRFDAAYGALLSDTPALGERAVALALDESGEQLALLGSGGALVALDPQGGAERWRVELDGEFGEQNLGGLSFSEDGRWLLATLSTRARVTRSSCTAAVVLDAANGQVLGRLAAGAGAVLNDADLAADGSVALTASSTGRVQLWSVPECEPLGEPFEHELPVSRARFSRDGARVIAALDADENSRLVAWDVETRTRHDFAGRHGARIVSLEVARDGERVVSTSRDMRIRTWRVDGAELASYNAWSQPIETRWTDDGQRLVTLGAAYYLHVWWGEHPPDVYSLVGHRGAVRSASFDPSGRRAVSCGDDGIARLWNTPRASEPRGGFEPGAQLAEFAEPGEHIVRAEFLTHERVLTFSDHGRLTGWSTADGTRQEIGTFDGVPVQVEIARGGSRKPTLLAVVTSLGSVHVFTLGGCGDIPPWRVDDQATSCALSPDGRYLAVGRRDASAHVYDLHESTGDGPTREHLWSARGSTHVVALALRPDGAQLAVACGDARVRFFEPLGGALPQLGIAAFPLRDVAYNADSTRLLATGPNGRAAMRLIDLERQQSDKSVRHEVYHAGNITSGRFDRSGRYVLTTSEDGSALVRDASQGERIAKFEGHGAPVLCGAFSVDEGELRVISGAANGVLRVWPVDPVPAARARQPREIRDWEHAREERLARPLPYPLQLEPSSR
jgi:serine/threonine protein kinase/WD40 repeat protein